MALLLGGTADEHSCLLKAATNVSSGVGGDSKRILQRTGWCYGAIANAGLSLSVVDLYNLDTAEKHKCKYFGIVSCARVEAQRTHETHQRGHVCDACVMFARESLQQGTR